MPLCNHPPICEGSECSIQSFCLSAVNPSFLYSCDKKEKRGMKQNCRHNLIFFLSKREFILQYESQHLIFLLLSFFFLFLVLTLFSFRFRARAEFSSPSAFSSCPPWHSEGWDAFSKLFFKLDFRMRYYLENRSVLLLCILSSLMNGAANTVLGT